MSKKTIEVEVRGPIQNSDVKKVIDFFDSYGTKITEKKRILIDYSTFLQGGIENRKKDIRIRATNGIPEIIVKLGVWGGNDNRKELSVLTHEGSFDTLVEIFGNLGFIKGILCVRNSKVYEYQGVEFSIIEVPGHSYFFEAEQMVSDISNTDEATKHIIETCQKIGLTLFGEKEFFEYIQRLNNEANEVFDFGSYTSNYFKNRFGL